MRQRQSCSVVPIKDMLLPWNRRLPALPEKSWSYLIIKLVLRMKHHASLCNTRSKHIEIWFPRFKTLEPGKVKMYVCQWLSRCRVVCEKTISCHKVSSGFRKELALRIAVHYIDDIVRASLCIKNIQKLMYLKHVQLTDIPRWCHCLRPLPHRRLSWALQGGALR